MFNTINDFYISSTTLIDRFNLFVKRLALKKNSVVDHICYKCDSAETFETMRALFEKESKFIYQSIISQRRIAYIKLKKGIQTELGSIYFLELSDQKPDNSQKNAFDHIEIVPKGISYEDLVTFLKDRGVEPVEVVRPHHTTHDIGLGDEFSVKLSGEPLIEKIKRTEID